MLYIMRWPGTLQLSILVRCRVLSGSGTTAGGDTTASPFQTQFEIWFQSCLCLFWARGALQGDGSRTMPLWRFQKDLDHCRSESCASFPVVWCPSVSPRDGRADRRRHQQTFSTMHICVPVLCLYMVHSGSRIACIGRYWAFVGRNRRSR